MNKKLKGFTLIECIVAMAILGIASMTMAQIYAGVSRTNTNNHVVSESLSKQMQYVEKKTNSESVEIKYTEASDKTNKKVNNIDGNKFITVIELKETSTDLGGGKIKYNRTPADNNNKYYYGCDVYVLYSRDQNDNKYSDEDESESNLRYKYMVAHVPTT